jgi:hypothetical protein
MDRMQERLSQEMDGNVVSIEKAILADVCLGIPLGKLTFTVPSDLDANEIGPAPDTYLFRGEQLALMKRLYERGDEKIVEAVSALVAVADEKLQGKPPSVTHKPRSRFGDFHDYQSLPKYWWPNPDTKSGLPYVNRDGETNPDCYSDDFDYIRLVNFSETTVILSLAAYLTGKRVYGQRLSLLLETWFISPETRQNPHFQFAQKLPGDDSLRWQGVIEARFLIYVAESVQLLAGTKLLKVGTTRKVREWFGELLSWLIESNQGDRARRARNNIGFWYDLQCMVYAQFSGKAELAERIVRDNLVPRLEAQMLPDGSLPAEIDRSYPKDYVAFTLAAMALISRLGERDGLELWDQRTADGRNFQVAHDWLLKAGDSARLLSNINIEDETATGDGYDLGLLLDAGVKLRAMQRVATTEAASAARLRDELARAREERKTAEDDKRKTEGGFAASIQKLEKDKTDLQAKVAAADAVRNEREAEIRTLKQELKKTEADYNAKLTAEANLRGRNETEIKSLGTKLEEFKADLQAKLAAADAVRKDREAEIRALKQELKKNEADYHARLMAEANRRGRIEIEIESLGRKLEKDKADFEARLAAAVEAEQNRLLALRDDLRNLQAENKALRRILLKDRDALLAYSRELEQRYRRVLASTSWRVTSPFRAVIRGLRSLFAGRHLPFNRVPRLPKLTEIPASATAASTTASKPSSRSRNGKEEDGTPHQPNGGAAVAMPSAGIKSKLISAAKKRLSPETKTAVKAALSSVSDTKNALKSVSQTVGKVQSKNQDPLEMLLGVQPRDEEALKAEYAQQGLDAEPDTFILYRIVGNDLYPRHKKGQSRENVRFLLENEPTLMDCEKRWVVNRIIDPEEESAIVDLLETHGQPFVHIPFLAEEYRKIGWDFDAMPAPGFLASKEFQQLQEREPQLLHDRGIAALYRLKNNYVMNNNGARNAALRDGRARAKWVLPFDGNSFVTAKAWDEIRQAVTANPHLKYFAVPMERVTDNAVLLSDDFTPHAVEEPQLLFRRDAGEEFNEDFPYGRRPKVELFWRLGIPGQWDRWRDDPWEQSRRKTVAGDPPVRRGRLGGEDEFRRLLAGAEGQGQLKNRGRVRQQAIIATIDHVDALVRQTPADPDGRAFYTKKSLDRLKQALHEGGGDLLPLARKIFEDAERALGEEPYSVVQKTTLAPSGDPQDYWHPAPYWWPDPKKKDGLPYIKKDGQRVPGTHMYEPAGAQYDRTRLQLMFDGTTALALGWYLTGRKDFATHGAKLIRTWFLDPATRMNPHLRYSQVRRGHNNDEGYESGIIELKDLYYVLDTVRLLEKSGAFGAEDSEDLKAWLREYLEWLETSKQGKKEVAAVNNHGTYFDLQTAAITAYLGEHEKLRDIFLRAQSRIAQQFTPEGVQPDEMKRSITQHYVFFNLQGWLNIFQLAKAHGLAIGDWDQPPQARVAAAFRWIMRHDMEKWPHEQIEPFDTDRAYPLAASAVHLGLVSDEELRSFIGDVQFAHKKPIFDPHDAVRPYWNLT